MDNDSKRIGLYIGKDLLKACDNTIAQTNATSRSEFISDAIEFYIAWLNSRNVSKVLTPALESVISSKILDTEDRIPLAQNKEFKSIKNAVIKEALKLNLTEDEIEDNENTDEESVPNPFIHEENTSSESDFYSDRGALYPRYSIKTNRNSVAVSSLYLLRYLCNMIQNQLRFEEKQKAQRTDKKLQQKINDKKQGLGLY